MKNQLITIMEALRLAKAELRTHETRRVKNASRTVQRLQEILFDPRVTQALAALSGLEAPSVIPESGGMPTTAAREKQS